MKYWIFQNNQVCGPYDADDLSQLPGYGAEALVCPEGRKGTRMGDWQRAGMVPALSLSLVKATQLAGAHSGGPRGGAVYGGLPPEPTLKDLAALGSLQEKVSFLENTVAQFQEGLQSKETELLSLHREIDLRKGIEADLNGKLKDLDERLTAVAKMRETIDSAVAAEKSVETEVKGVETAMHGVESSVQEVRSSISGVSGTVKDLETALDTQRKTIGELMAELERLKAERGTAQRAPAPEFLRSPFAEASAPGLAQAPAQAEAPAGPVIIERFGAAAPALGDGAPPSPALGASDAPAPALFGAPPPLAGEDGASAPPLQLSSPAPVVMPSLSGPSADAAPPPLVLPGPSVGQAPAFQPFGGGLSAPPAPAKGAGSLGLPLAAPVPTPGAPTPKPESLTAAPPPAKAKPRSKAVVLALLAFGVIGGGVFAFQAGLIPGLKPAAKTAAPPLPPPPPVEITPQAPPPEVLLEEAKRQAIDLVQSWPTSDKAVPVGQRLKAPAAEAGGLSPWMAEKLGDDSFQVNFYDKGASGKTLAYEFQANLAQKAVTPLNAAAKALLTGGPPAAKAPKVRVVPKKAAPPPKPAADDLDSLLGSETEPGSAAPAPTASEEGAAPPAESAAKPGPGSDEPAAGDGARPPEEASAPPAKAKPSKKGGKPAAKGADDAKLLDDLLQP